MYFKILPSDRMIFISNILIFFVFLILIFKPKYSLLWSLIGCIAFFVNIFAGGNILGLLFYCVSILILLQCNFFKNYVILKFIFIFTFFIFAFICQYINFGIELLKVSLFNIAIVLILIAAGLVFFAHDLKKYYTKKEIFNISQLDLTVRQNKCFILASMQLSFKEIGEQLCVSESVIKKEMTRIYQVLNINNYAEFLIFVEKYEIIG
ncbi:LuxR family transcriptional regulator [Treponema sp. OMZ 789]|uniref:helix-turn-helix transcriptional regulator n=2 Tax=Treponema TaxID=157 RepID=UPI0020A3970F|nr:LuxR family transcriptional regulator [Treponema sp. OMZ 789]UTC68386.1 LuxR family transcriptional regulator [Treponema sp. OMZ 789]